MKKISTIIALALILTISGVYAAWNYAQGTSASVEITREINMAQVNTKGNKGTISASPSDFAFLVDDGYTIDPGIYPDKYTAVLVGTGKLSITFTPSDGADDSTDNGIKMVAKIEIKAKENAAKYEGQTPITTTGENNAPVTIPLNDSASTTAELFGEQIAGALQLADVILDTKAKNDNFHTALKDYTIYITISEVE